MASITLQAPEFAVHEQVTVANVQDVVTFAQDHSSVEVCHLIGTVPLYLSLTTDAEVGGRRCYAIQPGQVVEISVPTQGPTTARLIAAGAVTYSLTGV